MKNFQHVAYGIFGLALAWACLNAHAMPTWAVAYTSNYTADKSAGSDASKSAYSGYYCTVETANTLFGGASADAITTYLSKNYDTFMAARDFAATKANVTAFDDVLYSDGQYGFLDVTGTAFSSLDYVAVAFYGSGSANGFFVFDANDTTLTPNGQLVFANDGTGGRDWEDAPEQEESIPEPTSGLLFLMGLAGLALKRRRA